MHVCPSCGSDRVVRSHTRWYEEPRRWWTSEVPYRCFHCRWRAWEIPSEHTHASSSTRDEAPAETVSSPRGKRSGTRRRETERARLLAVVGGASIVVSVMILAFAGFLIRSRASASVEPGAGVTRSVPAAGPIVSLQSARAYQNWTKTLWEIEGQVKNVSGNPLMHLEAVSTWLDRDGLIVATDRSLVDLARIMPGQTTRFHTTTNTRPGFSRFQVVFRTEDGIELMMTDDSTTSKSVEEANPDLRRTPAAASPEITLDPDRLPAIPAAAPVQ